MQGETASWLTLAASIGVPLIGVVVGGMIYWLRKLDDRQYKLQQELYEKFVQKDHLNEVRASLDKRLDEIRDNIKKLFDKIDGLMGARRKGDL